MIHLTILNINYFYFIISLTLTFSLFIIYFYYYIFYLQKKTKLNYKPKSLIKDKEYLLFKENLIKFYYYTLIILFYYIYKHKGLEYLLEGNPYFIYFLFSIFIFYFIILSNYFNMKLFNLCKEIKNKINLLNNINFNSVPFENNKKFYPNLNYKLKFNGLRNYSTNVDMNSNLNLELSEAENSIENFTNTEKELAIKEFKNKYKGGYLGYNHSYNLGNVSSFVLDSKENLEVINNLKPKIKEYLNEIPENMTYSVLPILRWQSINGEYKSITITSSIKITRFFSS